MSESAASETTASDSRAIESQSADEPMRIVYITAGAAGMYCGSCMHDNTLASALTRLGCDVQLVPTYTPIRTDEDSVSIDKVFFGGINVYLQQKVPLFRYLPRWMAGWLDQPWLIRWASSGALGISGKELGGLTVSMLRGTAGYQRKEVQRLVQWLKTHADPQVVNLTNVLIAGCVPELKKSLNVPVLVTLQGDDIFLDELPEPYKSQAFAEIRRLVDHIDGFVVFNQYYADHMSEYLGIPPEKFFLVPLGVDVRDFPHEEPSEQASVSRPPTIGYLARMAPEKGLHHMIDAFIHLRQMPGMDNARLEMAGWLGAHNQGYVDEQFAKLTQAGLDSAYQYHGTIDRSEKVRFLRRIDILSVPTVYREPKGLYVLEALACGVPVVQPEHGAFPELLAATGGGRLVRPEDPEHLAAGLAELLADDAARQQLGETARDKIHSHFDADSTAQATLDLYRRFTSGANSPASPSAPAIAAK